MGAFQAWIALFPSASDVTATSFLYYLEEPSVTYRVEYSEQAVKSLVPELREAGRTLWGGGTGLTPDELAYRLLTVHIDEAIGSSQNLELEKIRITPRGVLAILSKD
jgi:hypothetical protein